MKTLVLSLLVGAFALSGCATTSSPHKPHQMVRTELYFGQTKRDGTTVTPKEWKEFLDTEITPRFPDGLTLIPTKGQWRDTNGKLIRENTWLLVIVHPQGKKERRLFEEIRDRYHERFNQDLVLEVVTPVIASF